MNVSIILAAGEGTRMKSNKPKVLHKICGKPILEYVIRASENAHVDKNYVIIGHGGDNVREEFKDSGIIFKTQPVGEGYPYGTGYAVMQAIDCIQDDDNVVILYGDTPLIRSNTIENLMAYTRTMDGWYCFNS